MTRLIGVWCLLLTVPALALAGRGEERPCHLETDPHPGEQKAPEFEDIAEWINSKPLTIKGLKGKVVVVHFMAFG